MTDIIKFDEKSHIEKKLRDAENPKAYMLNPKTTEGHIMVKIMYAYDKAVNRIRLAAGSQRVPINELNSYENQINDMKSSLEAIYSKMSNGNGVSFSFMKPPGETIEERKRIAMNRKSYSFVPYTAEGEYIADYIKRFDPAYMKFRVTCPVGMLDKAITEVFKSICKFDEVTATLDAKVPAKRKYKTPGKIAQFRKFLEENKQGE